MMVVPKAQNTQSLQGKPNKKNENSNAKMVQPITPGICLYMCVPQKYSSASTSTTH